VPGSKSHTQRALLITALVPGRSCLSGPLDCDDTRAMRDALQALGVGIVPGEAGWWVDGGRLGAPPRALWCGEGGTVLRFLSALSLVVEGALLLDGSRRLSERPLGPLLDALEELGVSASPAGERRALPLRLERVGPVKQRCIVDAAQSSQFASGLLMVAPLLPRGLTLELQGGPPVSRPYLELTLQTMRDFGARVDWVGDCAIQVEPGGYAPRTLQIQGDWSSAAFLLAAAMISGRRVHLANLGGASAQGDRVIVELLAELERGGSRFDLTACPDLIAPLAAACVFADGPSEITGVAHARLKESDRVAVLAQGLRRAGVTVEERSDGLRITPAKQLHPASLDPAGDHRMAMAFALLSLKQPGIEIRDPACVSKSFPAFWDALGRLR
jgi:3-phosphoshikimate 1-carboxyvinyltransferase